MHLYLKMMGWLPPPYIVLAAGGIPQPSNRFLLMSGGNFLLMTGANFLLMET